MPDYKKAVIGISGGVDSSVAAYLLKKNGYEVTGVYFNFWESIDGGRFTESARENEMDARKAADRIGIDFITKNYEKTFHAEVVDYFIREYLRGRTPNPCVRCNRDVKFRYLVETADELGAGHISTGHYVQLVHDADLNRYFVRKTDNVKDQSYMFHTLAQDTLARLIMPLGAFKDKVQVRKLAESLGLETAKKKDSQEICFIQDNDYGAFIERNAKGKFKPGAFVDEKGNRLGTHKGIPFYTVGQRKGLGIALGKPAYVKEIDVDNNIIMLSEDGSLFTQGLIAKDVNSVKYESIPENKTYDIKTRYTARFAKGRIRYLHNGDLEVVFDSGQRAVTPGQSVVLYEGDDLVGGGVIKKTFG